LQNISDEKFESLFEALENNTHLETLSLANVGLTDKVADKLAQALEKNNTLRVVNVETNLITPSGIVRLIKSLLKTKSVEEFRASNQVSKMSWMVYARGLCWLDLWNFILSSMGMGW
jgi:tropomodulin